MRPGEVGGRDSGSLPRVLPMGDRALLVEVAALADVLALHRRLEASAPDGVVALVPAARTVLVQVDPRVLALAAARAWIARELARPDDDAGSDDAHASPAREPETVTLDIVYDGPDLDETAAALGLSPAALVERHSSAEWTVAFTGFAPGFGYLVSPDWPYDLPRLESPRTRVPGGSVGLAGEFSGAYPRETPGGWRLIGTTAAPLFDPEAARPALLAPGMRVRFRGGRADAAAPGPAPAPVAADHATTRGFRIVAPGLLATVQDLGREGFAAQGIARSGALDRGALRVANRLLGNPEGAAAIEITLGGFRAVASSDLWVAVTGAFGRVRIDGEAVDPYHPHSWPSGAELAVDAPEHGVRTLLAVRGGVDVPAVAGSRAADVLAGIGPAPLRAGDRVAVGADTTGPIPPVDLAPWGAPSDEVELELAPGPRADWFTLESRRALYEASWTLSARADRVGVRLEGPALERARAGELPSEGMVPGAVQVPPSGLPTVLLADGPVTGGYPVIAVVTDASLDAFAQLRPGGRLRFRHARV